MASQECFDSEIPSLQDIDPTTQKPYTKSQIKKIKKRNESTKKKALRVAALSEKQHKDAVKKEEERKMRIENSKKRAKIKENPDLLPALKIKIYQIKENVGGRVRINGWVHTLRDQGGMMFILLRDGTGHPGLLQAVLESELIQHYEALTLHREASVCMYGTLSEDIRSPGGIELQVDY